MSNTADNNRKLIKVGPLTSFNSLCLHLIPQLTELRNEYDHGKLACTLRKSKGIESSAHYRCLDLKFCIFDIMRFTNIIPRRYSYAQIEKNPIYAGH